MYLKFELLVQKKTQITASKIKKTKLVSIKYYKSLASQNRRSLTQFFNVNTATIM